MLAELEAQLKTALLAGDKATVDTLKLLKSALLVEGKSGAGEVDELAVVRKQIKMRQDAAESYNLANQPDKAQSELAEIDVLAKFLPQQMSAEELEAAVQQLVDNSGVELVQSNMGRLIGMVSAEVGDKASKADIAQIVKLKLN